MRKRLALLAAFLLLAAVSFALGARGKPAASGSIELGVIHPQAMQEHLSQEFERGRRALAESERVREDLRQENETLRGKLLDQERRALQQDAKVRDLQDQVNALWGPEANLDRCDEFKRSCRTLAGSCAELFERLSRKCAERDKDAKEIPSEEKPTIEEQQHGKNEKET